MSRCIITGCDLLDGGQGRWVHGDLHEEGNCWIFNACLADGETAWMYSNREFANTKTVILFGAANYFERRGVIVLLKDNCMLNQAAQEYIKS